MTLYLLPFLAVILSYLVVLAIRPKDTAILKLLLAFSGAFLLALTILELLPSVYALNTPKITGTCILLGILLQIILEYLSQGAEHGHVHHNGPSTAFPWALFTGLCAHAFLEGFPIQDHKNLVYGILVHKIPIAMILGIFLLNSGRRPLQIALFMGWFALMTPLGSFVAKHAEFPENVAGNINAIVVGVLLHVSTVILFESSEGHTFNLRKLLVILLGMGAAFLL